MRRSRKSKPVETFKTRRCVVRLQRMKTQPLKVTRSVAAKGPTPLKKRSVTSVTISTPANSMKAKERLKTPVMQRNIKIIQSKKLTPPVVEELPPTIAAGRSRRAHKPNPKYASEDLVTPKNLKPGRRTENEAGKGQRRTSTSSLDDFFNKDSSEEDFDIDAEDTEDDKMYKAPKRITSDSDFADTIEDSDTSVQPQKKGPGRPRKYKNGPPAKRPAGSTSMSAVLNKSSPISRSLLAGKNTPNVKTPPSQLQQLRRTLGANTVSPLAMGRKRKIDENAANTSLPVTAKRFVLSTGAMKPVASSGIVTRRNSPSQQINNGRTSTPNTQSLLQKRETTSNMASERKTIQTKATSHPLQSKAVPTTKSQQPQQRTTAPTTASGAAVAKGSATKANPPTKQSSSSASLLMQRAAVSKQKAVENAKERPVKKVDESPKEALVDDFETMPTFTIVNINDIINKKGDVLISKASVNKRSPSITERRSSSAAQPSSKVLASKVSPDRAKSSQFCTSTPLMKKPTEKNVSNSFNKIAGKKLSTSSTPISGEGSASDKKPAPRILNSVVGRKTKPIKPMIANLDILGDSPSCSLSLYDDDDDEDEEMDDDSQIDGSSSNEIETLETSKEIQSKSHTASATTKSKSSDPKTAAKENSLAATNIQQQNQTAPSKLSDTHKLSPEKVIVSRQGDKIIKKITCFETWYVINIPADAPEEYERNNLSMPLIELANANETIKLPSEMWTTKVTLYELSALTLSKSNAVPYTGDLTEQNIAEEDRHKYQPSCVMFRRIVADRLKSQLPYDRAVIFKNKTFFTNIEGKNVKLIGAPSTISQVSEVETLLHIVDTLTLQSSLVEPAATVA